MEGAPGTDSPLVAPVKDKLRALPHVARAERIARVRAAEARPANRAKPVTSASILPLVLAELSHSPASEEEQSLIMMVAGLAELPAPPPTAAPEDKGVLPCLALLAGTCNDEEGLAGWCENYLSLPPAGLPTAWPEASETQARDGRDTPIFTVSAGSSDGPGSRQTNDARRWRNWWYSWRGWQSYGKRSSGW